MVELVGEHHVALAQQRGQHAGVRRVPAVEQLHRFDADPARHLAFELDVLAVVADDQARRAGARSFEIEGGLRRLDQPGITGEPEVIVRGEVEDLHAIDQRVHALSTIEHSWRPQSMDRCELGQLRLRFVIEVHDVHDHSRGTLPSLRLALISLTHASRPLKNGDSHTVPRR